ncbi:hypothetical protein WJX84_002215 [Apatococcus fuscideae]|uniref:UBX domain-containing protein n=1 Tax=Apatococcus fuscideae TaxID=2026836 RepID=A0AAW1SQR9_9CHLO
MIRREDTNRRLREEQDAAFQQSLREDQERERKREEKRKAEQDAKQAAADAERRAKEEEDARQRAVVDAAEALQRRKLEKAAALGPAPPRGSPDTTAVRIRLKDGSSHQRVFSAQDPLQAVFDFVESLDQLDSWQYSLVSTYPRLTLSQTSAQQALSQLQLVPQATLFVQSEDGSS